MGGSSKIEWCDHTFNPWHGCTKVSPGCDHCYAEAFSKRIGFRIWGQNEDRRFFGDKHWNEPLKWNADAAVTGKRARVFCASMADIMEDRRDLDQSRDKLWNLIHDTPCLDWLLLTKRPQNYRRFLPPSMIANPLPNVIGMTTVESQEHDWRVRALLETPFVIRGISYEPALGYVNFQHVADGPPSTGCWIEALSGNWCCYDAIGGLHRSHSRNRIDWIIAGGESGPGSRLAELDWFRSVQSACSKAGVAFFMKQLGGVRDKRSELEQLPEDLRIREFPDAKAEGV